ELRQLMALRSRSSVRDRSCPELDRLLESSDRETRDSRFAALTRSIDAAIDDIVDPAHRAAAGSLLGSSDGRWRTVSQRGADAAAEFGCGWDAYRRRRTNGPSQLDDTLQALAQSMVRRTRGSVIQNDSVHEPGAEVPSPPPIHVVT